MKIKKEVLKKVIEELQYQYDNLNDGEEIDFSLFKEDFNFNKFVITITNENREELQRLLKSFKLGLGWLENQSLFYDDSGYKYNDYKSPWTWNCDNNNICCGEKYSEIDINHLKKIIHKLKIEI